MSEPRIAFHPSVFILEEMEVLDWNRQDLSIRMCEKLDDYEYGVWRLALDFYLEIGPTDPGLRINADAFARAFGTSSDFWLNLESAWLVHVGRHSDTGLPAVERLTGDGQSGT